MKYYGVDGCRYRWIYIGIDENDQYEFGVVTLFQELQQITNSASLILVDIPIGLREENPRERLCDLKARKVLGNRRSSVFPPPSRLALGYDNYLEASELNFQNTGRRLSKQSFAISKKIQEVDKFLTSTGLQSKYREMHPEICFWALNNYEPMLYNKKKSDGLKERMSLLTKFFTNTNKLIEGTRSRYLRKDVALDDILDALVGAVSARFKENLKQLPEEPEIDDRGLKMEIVYPAIQ